MSETNEAGKQSQMPTIAVAFIVAAFGFELAGLLTEPSSTRAALTGLAGLATILIWRIASGLRTKPLPTSEQISYTAGNISPTFSRADFDALPLAVLIVDSNAQIIAANKSASDEFGRFDFGTPLLLRFRAPEMRQSYQLVCERLEAAHFEMHERVPMERWIRVDVCPVQQGVGKSGNCLIMFRDISESRKLDRIRADFVANASHELRTPLASISGFIDTLRGPAKDDENARQRFLGIMQEQANRMSRLIDDLLSLSRLEMRSMTDDAELLNLVSITNEAIDSMQPVAADSGVEIERQYKSETFMIRGIRDELIQVVENLVENACKYGKSGKKVIVEIERRKADEASEIILSVRDFGPGIEAEHIPRLTERFYRANTNSASIQKGTGLGLAIVKHIVTRHRGRLSIASKPGKGSTFAIFFPETDKLNK